MKDLKVHEIVFEYADDSGSLYHDNFPKRGDKFDGRQFGMLDVKNVETITKYTDGGAKPFTVRVTCFGESIKIGKGDNHKRCENCGRVIDIGNEKRGMHKKNCDFVWGRRGWRQLGVYDG